MRIKQYQVDAFANRIFEGNPAAVCPLDAWLDDGLLQSIAAENNLAETAFFVPPENGHSSFGLRWFTPVAEVDLCGHATLAAAHIIFDVLGHKGPVAAFETRSGQLLVERKGGGLLAMDFPAAAPAPCDPPPALAQALGLSPDQVLAGYDYISVFEDEDSVRSISPDLGALAKLDLRAVAVTAPGRDHDFVSRVFAPKLGIPEDPVTGSAHCELAPYWAARFGRNVLRARQVSRRGGDVLCELRGDRVILSGRAATFMEADIFI